MARVCTKMNNLLNFKARFIVTNGIMAVMLFGAVMGNWFMGFFSLGYIEIIMGGFLLMYFIGGAIAATRKRWDIVKHVANGLPMWALAFTGIGIINAAAGLVDASTEQLIQVFKNLALAIAPNIIGVLLMVWLREIAMWCSGEEI